MGIHLDWDVESDSGHAAVEEDASVIASRRRKQTMSRRVLIGVCVALVLIGAAAWWRIQQVQKAMRDTLQATVESETLALRLGDSRKFMQLQGAAEDWRDKQRNIFDQFERTGEIINVTGKILDLHIAGSEARVVVEVLIDGQNLAAVWLYEYTPAKGWKHVATESEPWSMTDVEHDWFTIPYFPSDKAYADQVELQLTDWWRKAIDATNYSVMPRVHLVIDPDAQEVAWDDEMDTLTVPVQSDNAPRDLDLDRTMMKRFAVEYWLDTYGVRLRGRDEWLKQETTLYFRHLFDPADPSARFFDALIAAYGPDVIANFASRMRSEEYDDPAIMLRRAIDASAPRNLEGDALKAHLTAALQAEGYLAQATQQAIENSQAARIFTDGIFPNQAAGPVFQASTEGVLPESLKVEGIEQFGDVLWARVRYGVSSGPEQYTTSVNMFYTYVPFRQADGRWVHTQPQRSDGGGTSVQSGAFVTLIYDALDANAVSSMQPDLERLYLQAASDLGVQQPNPMTLIVAISDMSTISDPQNAVYVPSNFVDCCLPADISDQQYLQNKLQDTLLFNLYNQKVTSKVSNYYYSMFDWAALDYEYERLGLDLPYWIAMIKSEDVQRVEGVLPPSTIGEVIYFANTEPYDAAGHYQIALEMLGARTLIDLLIERYGDEAFIALLDTVEASGDIDTWFTTALGPDATMANLEAEWLARFDAALRARFGVGLGG